MILAPIKQMSVPELSPHHETVPLNDDKKRRGRYASSFLFTQTDSTYLSVYDLRTEH